MNATDNKTAEVIYKMMTESTGAALCDSGGAYGRNWERNQKKSLEDFMNEPKITMEWGPTVSVFHFFVEHLLHDADLQTVIDDYAERNPDDYWPDVIGGVAEEQGWKFDNSYNTYNDSDTLLSQVFQGFEMTDVNGDSFLIVQLHNGCDVRGGYTSPYAFRYRGYWDDFVCGMIDYYLDCDNEECDFSVSVHGPDIFDRDGCSVDLDWQHIESSTCPKCKTEGSLKPYVGWE